MEKQFSTIEHAIKDLQEGRIIIVVDDSKRENEADLVVAAEHATAENINFMISHGKGIVCTPMLKKDLARLQIPQMVNQNTDIHQTAFTISVDHTSTTTGVSPKERSLTIQSLIHPNVLPEDFRKPGHVFPLEYKDGGVFIRAGHTEAAIDLMRIANLYPAATICEIISADGSMMRFPEVWEFAKKYNLKVVSVENIIQHRKKHEPLVKRVAESNLPTRYGLFKIIVYEDDLDNYNHLAIVKGNVTNKEGVLTRIHSECITGDVFGSKRCDCGEQLHQAMERIEKEGCGLVIYMRQEGRGIGLINKIRSYQLQEKGLDTVEANKALGFEADLREYSLSAKIIEELGVKSIRLLTNNPAKKEGLLEYGVQIKSRESIITEPNECNIEYLNTKKRKMRHCFSLRTENED